MFYPSLSGFGYSGNFASAEAVAAQSTAREAETKVDLIAHDIDRLLLITEAMWMLMKKEHGYADDVLTKLIMEIVKYPPQACPNCGKMNLAKRLICIYCGKPMLAHPFAN